MPNFSDDQIQQGLYRYVKSRTWQNRVLLNEEIVGYGREFFDDFSVFNTRKDWLTGYGLDNNAQVLVVGSGFGYLLEYLIGEGITDVWGIEPGSYYWDPTRDAEWAVGMKARTANDWLGSGTEQDSLDALPGVPNNERFGWIVDEDAAPMHSDAELPAFIAACEARLQGNAKGRIVHLVTTGSVGDSSVNWKSLADWKLVAPDHNWVDIGTGEVAT